MQTQDDAMGFPTAHSNTGIKIEPGRYIVKLLNFERVEPGQWGERRKWIFALAYADTGAAVYEPDGKLVEFAEWTSLKMGPKARARFLFEGLLGRELGDGEDGRAIATEALNKMGLALIGPNQADWTCILSLQPYVPEANGKKPVAAAAAPKNALDPFATE